MNAATFNALLTPYFELQLPKSRSDAAKAIATAYHLSNIGQTTTIFGAPMLSADKTILETFIELSLDINFYGSQTKAILSSIIASITSAIQELQAGSKTALKDVQQFISSQINSLVSSLPAPLAFLGGIISGLVDSIIGSLVSQISAGIDKISEEIYNKLRKLQGIIDSLDVSGIAYAVMAAGFSLYWLTARMSPMPPMPPCIAPTGGTIILFPGSPIPLNKDLKETFQSAQSTPQAIAKFYNALIGHQLTVAGIYTGIIPLFPSPVPGPPIPWFGLLNIPLPT